MKWAVIAIALVAFVAPARGQTATGTGSAAGTGTITVQSGGGGGAIPAFAGNGAGCVISNDENHTTDTVTSYHCALLNPTISGNTVVIQLRYKTPAQTVTWTDNIGGNTYTRAVQCADSPRSTVSEIWYTKPAAGVFDIVPHFGAATQFAQSSPFEFYNVGALDSATCQASTGTNVIAPSITPTITGDLLFHFGAVDSTQHIGSCTVGSQAGITWQLREAMVADSFPACMQFGVYNSTAAFAPTFTINTGASYLSAAAAFRPATAGSAPPAGIRAIYIQHDNTSNEQDASVALQEPVSGNMFAVLFNSGCVDPSITDCAYPTAASDGTNTYNQVGATTISPGVDGGASVANIWYAKGTTPGTYHPTWTMHPRSSGGNGSTWILYDIAGASANPLDTGMGLVAATGDQSTGGPGGPLTTITTTPSQSNEIILALLGLGWNTPTALSSPSGSIFISTHYITESNSSHADLNSGGGIYRNGGSLAGVAWTWQQDESNFPGVGSWVSLGVAFH